MKPFVGTIPLLLYVHLVLRMLYFSDHWDPPCGLLVGVTLMGFGLFVPILLIYPCYLERFTGKRAVILILLIPVISLAWAVANGMMFTDVRSLFRMPLIVESGALFFVLFSILYSCVFQLYEKINFYSSLKMKVRFFYNDPPAHIRDFDKTASMYIGTVLVIIMLSVYVVVFESRLHT